MKIINCFDKYVRIKNEKSDGTFAPSGFVPFVKNQYYQDNLVIENKQFITTPIYVIKGLPDPSDDTFYLVSEDIFNASKRLDLLTPYKPTVGENGIKGDYIKTEKFVIKNEHHLTFKSSDCITIE